MYKNIPLSSRLDEKLPSFQSVENVKKFKKYLKKNTKALKIF